MASFEFGYDSSYYSVQGASTLQRENFSAMKKEYTRMRDVAQKRIKRLEKEMPNSKAYQRNVGGFKKVKDIDPRDFAKAFSELYKFVNAKGSTVSGQRDIRRKTIKTWQEQGINLNERNYDKAIQILEEMRKQKIVYGSDKVVELADSMLELDDQQTNDFLDHLDKALQHSDEIAEIPELSGYTFDEVMKLIGD